MRTVVRLLSVVSLVLVFSVDAGASGIKFFLANSGLDLDARARVHFGENEAGRQVFGVKVEALEAGEYAVLVAGEVVGEFSTSNGGEGKLVLRGGPLGFDPRGQEVKVVGLGTGEVYFHGSLPPAVGDPPGPIELAEAFASTGTEPKARGRAWLRSHRGKVRFGVRVRGLPPGVYDLIVGGADVGDIHVHRHRRKGKGHAKFNSRFAHGKVMLLDFDPLCSSVQVAQTTGLSSVVFLTIEEFGASSGLCSSSPSTTTTTTSTTTTMSNTTTSSTTTTTHGGPVLM